MPARGAQVALDVDRECLEWGDIENSAAPLWVGLCRRGEGRTGQIVEGPQKGGQRLARTSRCDDQGILSTGDGSPGAYLGIGRPCENLPEPCCGRGREEAQWISCHIVYLALED